MESTRIEPTTLSYFENTVKRIVRHTEHLSFNRWGELILGEEKTKVRNLTEKRMEQLAEKKQPFHFTPRTAYHRQLNRRCGVSRRGLEIGKPTGQWRSVYEM